MPGGAFRTFYFLATVTTVDFPLLGARTCGEQNRLCLAPAHQIEGKAIILSAAEEVFSDYIKDFIKQDDSEVTKWQVAAQLYAHLGYGSLNFDRINDDIIIANSSHYVEGWKTGFQNANRSVCTFTEGYLQGVIHGITGDAVTVTEISCINLGDDCCRSKVDRDRTRLIFTVKDTGKGIADAERERIFEPFVQTDIGTHSEDGTGLGLALGRRFAQLMQRDITFASQPKIGSVFTLEITARLCESDRVETSQVKRRVIGIAPR